MVGPSSDHHRTILGPGAFKVLCISCVGDFGGLNVLVVSGIGVFFDGFSAWAVNLRQKGSCRGCLVGGGGVVG